MLSFSGWNEIDARQHHDVNMMLCLCNPVSLRTEKAEHSKCFVPFLLVHRSSQGLTMDLMSVQKLVEDGVREMATGQGGIPESLFSALQPSEACVYEVMRRLFLALSQYYPLNSEKAYITDACITDTSLSFCMY